MKKRGQDQPHTGLFQEVLSGTALMPARCFSGARAEKPVQMGGSRPACYGLWPSDPRQVSVHQQKVEPRSHYSPWEDQRILQLLGWSSCPHQLGPPDQPGLFLGSQEPQLSPPGSSSVALTPYLAQLSPELLIALLSCSYFNTNKQLSPGEEIDEETSPGFHSGKGPS